MTEEIPDENNDVNNLPQSRILSCIILLTTSILWFGFAWNVGMAPGILHFSAHFFWFLTQIAFHCYQKDEIPQRQPARPRSKKYALLFFIDRTVHCCRLFIFLSFLCLTIFQPWDDPLNIIIVPCGRLSLYLIFVVQLIVYGTLCIIYRMLVFKFPIEENQDQNFMSNINKYSIIKLIKSLTNRFLILSICKNSSEKIKQNKQFHPYKLFITIIIRLLLTAVNPVIVNMDDLRFTGLYHLFYELEMFYNQSNFEVKFLDQFHNYKIDVHGEISYDTIVTADVVLVGIRVINQIMSVLFPHSLNKLIIQYMSMLETSIHEREHSNLTKRFYVKQMVNILEEINREYGQNRSLVLVGHSLGGGLAKLAGIGLNKTDLIVSISGPGVTFSHTKYEESKHVTTESLNLRIFNLFHDRDIVPWADKQEGLI
ncbi:hypothetical protein I4U23_006144 [Adineta vaga]|nr:hypothetical protein I4U23_006144 [Adineta vaga]